ncbi:MAG: sugar nucleotide-binding protein, partial [Phycisphaerae bacterium]|nr:sugar nucleotide-binding protein [Phycisphaerae bacterium]
LVFDGQDPPYDESARPNPLSGYGRTKLEAEAAVLACRRGVVVRPSLMFGLPAVTRATTFGLQLAALRDGLELRLFEDEFRTALWLEDAARAIVAIGRSDFVGLLHLAGPERISRLEMGLAMAKSLGLSSDRIRPVSSASMSFPEPRPSDVSLDGARLRETFSDLPAPLTVFQATGRITPEQLAALRTGG